MEFAFLLLVGGVFGYFLGDILLYIVTALLALFIMWNIFNPLSEMAVLLTMVMIGAAVWFLIAMWTVALIVRRGKIAPVLKRIGGKIFR